MSDLYIESFFHRGSAPSIEHEQQRDTGAPVKLTEESIDQPHFYFRVLSDEVNKLFQDETPFPLILKKLETAIFSQNNERSLELLDDLEELLDIKYLTK